VIIGGCLGWTLSRIIGWSEDPWCLIALFSGLGGGLLAAGIGRDIWISRTTKSQMFSGSRIMGQGSNRGSRIRNGRKLVFFGFLFLSAIAVFCYKRQTRSTVTQEHRESFSDYFREDLPVRYVYIVERAHTVGPHRGFKVAVKDSDGNERRSTITLLPNEIRTRGLHHMLCYINMKKGTAYEQAIADSIFLQGNETYVTNITTHLSFIEQELPNGTLRLYVAPAGEYLLCPPHAAPIIGRVDRDSSLYYILMFLRPPDDGEICVDENVGTGN